MMQDEQSSNRLDVPITFKNDPAEELGQILHKDAEHDMYRHRFETPGVDWKVLDD